MGVKVCDFHPSPVLRPVEQLSSEVVVGAQCGSAVLRGANVFVPGILASPKCKSQKQMLGKICVQYTSSYIQQCRAVAF